MYNSCTETHLDQEAQRLSLFCGFYTLIKLNIIFVIFQLKAKHNYSLSYVYFKNISVHQYLNVYHKREPTIYASYKTS